MLANDSISWVKTASCGTSLRNDAKLHCHSLESKRSDAFVGARHAQTAGRKKPALSQIAHVSIETHIDKLLRLRSLLQAYYSTARRQSYASLLLCVCRLPRAGESRPTASHIQIPYPPGSWRQCCLGESSWGCEHRRHLESDNCNTSRVTRRRANSTTAEIRQ